MTFSEEPITEALLAEVRPLLEKHWKEIAHYKDIELNPDYSLYLKMQEMGMIHAYGARLDDNNKLIGYAVYVVRPNLHYRQCLQATEDIIFFDPDHRGHGMKFIMWCDEQLKKIGVMMVTHHIKFSFDWSKALMRMGYEKTDMQLCKRLDK
jgi:GNAT superfamily N-acetyltransferase